MASPPRKSAGARVAPQRCPILRLLTTIVYHLPPLFATVQNSIVLDMGSTLQDGRKQLAVYQKKSNDYIKHCLGLRSPNQVLADYLAVM